MKTEQEMIDLLAYEVEQIGSQEAWAHHHGITASYVSYVLSKRRLPGPRIAKALGYVPVTVYLPEKAG